MVGTTKGLIIDVVAMATVGDQVNELMKFLRAYPEVDPRMLAEQWFQKARHVLDPVAARLMISLAVHGMVQSD